MRKSEKVAAQFSSVIRLLELADGELQMIREIEQLDMEKLARAMMNLADEVEDVMYCVCAPLEMEEDARDAEIVALERRLAELKAAK